MLEQFQKRSSEVSAVLRSLGEVADSLGAASIANRIRNELACKVEEDRFHLVVMGEFNHGKTSFVNALLGENVLPTGVTPTTSAIHHLKFADSPKAAVVCPDGRREDLNFAAARRFAVGGGADGTPVDFLEIGYPAPLLRERILLVDTPGVNDLSLQRADITFGYIPKSDAVLFLLDAGQILKESERQFLTDKILKASRDKIIFVITKWDILSESEQAEAYAYATQQLSSLVSSPVVFPVSSDLELKGRTEASGFGPLLAHLTDFLGKERGRILLENAIADGDRAVELVGRGIDAKRRALTMERAELDRRIEMLERDLQGTSRTIEQRRVHIREAIGGIKTGARKDLERFCEDTIRQLPHVIESANPKDLKKFFGSFLEDAFRKWAEEESQEIADKLEALAEETIALIREDARDTTRRVGETLGADMGRLEIHVDTLRYDAGVAAVLALGVGMLFVNVMIGGLLTVAAPVLAFVVRDRIDAEYKKKALEEAPKALRHAAAAAGPKLDEMIEQFAQRLDAWVVTAGEELYREVLEVLNATREARCRGDHNDQASLSEVERDEAELARVRGELRALRDSFDEPTSATVAA